MTEAEKNVQRVAENFDASMEEVIQAIKLLAEETQAVAEAKSAVKH